MYAIIEDSGTQIRVAPGDVVDVDLRELADGDRVEFDRVLLIGPEGEESAVIGAPYVEGAAVEAVVVGEVAGDKVEIIKFRRRKGYRRHRGHRQHYLRVKIEGIRGPATAARSRPAKSEPAGNR